MKVLLTFRICSKATFVKLSKSFLSLISPFPLSLYLCRPNPFLSSLFIYLSSSFIFVVLLNSLLINSIT
ncbi:hypothetical protein AB4K20DRAFT_1886046 [Rhizopus microsporus]